MAWIEMHQALFTHRKTVEAAEILDLPEVYVVGHIAAIWSWALDNAPDGRIKTRPRLVERVAQWQGESGKLLAALIEVEFMEKDGDDLIIHDWMDYAGRLIDKRQKNTERMRGARAKTANEQPDNVQNTCDAQPSHVQGLPYRTVPNHTQPYPTVPKNGAQMAHGDPFIPEGTQHKPGTIDLKAILADRPHWAAWLEANRPAPQPGKTSEGFDRWKVCQWLNGKEESPHVPSPPPAAEAPRPSVPEQFRGCLGEIASDACTWVYISQAIQRLTRDGIWVKGESKDNPEHCRLVIESAQQDFLLSDPRAKNMTMADMPPAVVADLRPEGVPS